MKLVRGVLFAIFAFLAVYLPFQLYGIYFYHWSHYNIGYIERYFNSGPEYAKDLYVQLCIRFAPALLKWFTLSLKPIFTIPGYFLIACVLTKLVFFILLFLILRRVRFLSVWSAFLAMVLLICSYVYDAILPFNGMFDSPLLFRASVSSLFTMGGVLLILRRKWILASLAFGLSYQFHLLNGVSAFVFIYMGCFLYAVETKKWHDLAILTGLNFFFLVPYLSPRLGLTDELISIKSWHDYIMVRDNDDMSFTVMSARFLATIVFPFPAFLLLAEKYKNREINFLRKLHYLYILVFFGLYVIESLHLRGIFFGKISELFIGIQFRRGIWIPYLVSFVSVFIVFRDFEERIPKKIFYLLALFLVSEALNFNLLTNLLMIGVFAGLIWAERLPKWLLIVPLVYFFIVRTNFTWQGNSLLLNYGFWMSPNVKAQIPGLFLLTLVFGLLILLGKRVANVQIYRHGLIVLSYFIFLVPVFDKSYKSHSLQTSWGYLTKVGLFEELSYREIEKIIYDICHGSERVEASIGDHHFMRLVEKLIELNVEHRPVLMPLKIKQCGILDYAILARSPVYSDENLDRGYSMFSREYASYYNQKLIRLFGEKKGLNYFYQDHFGFKEVFWSEYEKLKSDRVQSLFKSGEIKYFVTKIFYPELKIAFNSGPYYLYGAGD